MPPRKQTKRPSAKKSLGGSPMTLVYVTGVVLTLGFAWVVWPYLAEFLPSSDQDKEVRRLEREHPEAEVFTLTPDVKKNP